MKSEHHETGARIKEWGGKLPVLLVYPDTYRAGMSNLAVHALYRLLNSIDTVVCERCFWRKGQKHPVSLESRRQVSDFTVIAFSVSFESDFINVVDFLAASGIEVFASKRTHGVLVIAGGIAVTLNPEPIADFMDACVIGEAEGVTERIMETIHAGIDAGAGRPQILAQLDHLDGVYVPSLYRVTYAPDGSIERIEHRSSPGKKVKRHTVRQLVRGASTTVYTSDTAFSGMHLQEVSRGCGYRCRFCISGYAYLPPRTVDLDALKNDLSDLPASVTRVGVVSPMVTDYPDLHGLLEFIHACGLKASLSSLRADKLSYSDLNAVDISTDQFSVAIAPEAGTQRLRRVLNKDVTDEQILGAADFLGRRRVNTLKLYFLIGLPQETDEDIAAIARLAVQVRHRLRAGKGRVIVSINPLIPKPFTPFQWLPLIRPEEVKAKLGIIRTALKSSGITIEWEKHYLLQAVLSRGDRRLSGLLLHLAASQKSIRLGLGDSGTDLEYYAWRQRPKDEVLPWDFIHYGFKKDFLLHEYDLGLKGIITPVCSPDTCRLCGICAP